MANLFNPDMVVLAREAADYSQADLCLRTGLTQSKLSKVENGLIRPTSDEVAKIATALCMTVDFFYQTDKVYGLGSSLLFNRKKKTVTVGVQRQVQAKVNIARMQIDRLLRGAEVVQTRTFVRLDIDQYDKDTEEIARRVRAAWKIPVGPVANLTRIVESAGGIVVRADFGIDEIDATHLWLPDLPPLFFINSRMPADKYRFTLAHEIGHAVMHEHPTGDIEDEANKFARSLLMPAEQIFPQLIGMNIERAARLKPHWRVSMAALIVRAYDLGSIDETRYHNLFKRLSALGYRRHEPIPVPDEHPEVVKQLVEIHRTSLRYSDQDIRGLLFTNKPDFIQLPDSLGPAPLLYDDPFKFPSMTA